MKPRKPLVLVFTEKVLSLSETFIADHCRSLIGFDYCLVGLERVAPQLYGDLNIRTLFSNRSPNLLERAAFRLGMSKAMDDIIREIKPDVIHAHYAMNGAFMSSYAKRHAIPLFVTLHGYDVTRKLKPISFYSWIYKFKKKAMVSGASKVLASSEYLYSQALLAGFSAENMCVHYLGIPLPKVPANAGERGLPSAKRIAFVGRLVEKKGIDNVIAAYRLILNKHPDAELHIIGDGPLKWLVEDARSSLKGIAYYGAQPHYKVLDVLRTASIFSMPSRIAQDGDAEGFGLVLLEAQAVGVPVVTSNISGTREAIQDGVTGLLVNPSDIDDIAKAFDTLLSNDEMRLQMGSHAAKHVKDSFDISHRSGVLESMYRNVLN